MFLFMRDSIARESESHVMPKISSFLKELYIRDFQRQNHSFTLSMYIFFISNDLQPYIYKNTEHESAVIYESQTHIYVYHAGIL